MSEHLFSRLYWRPYIYIGISILLVFISSLLPMVLPHAWLAKNVAGYQYYMFKGISWMVKLAMLCYAFGLYKAFRGKLFPKLERLCTGEVRAVITDYKQSWSRGSQLCPVFTYTVEDKEYTEALNEAKGTRNKDGEHIDKGYTLKLPRKLRYNPEDPKQFYIVGEEYYSRKVAIVRYVIFSLMFFLQLYMNYFVYLR